MRKKHMAIKPSEQPAQPQIDIAALMRYRTEAPNRWTIPLDPFESCAWWICFDDTPPEQALIPVYCYHVLPDGVCDANTARLVQAAAMHDDPYLTMHTCAELCEAQYQQQMAALTPTHDDPQTTELQS